MEAGALFSVACMCDLNVALHGATLETDCRRHIIQKSDHENEYTSFVAERFNNQTKTGVRGGDDKAITRTASEAD
jgi:hypothetical protein